MIVIDDIFVSELIIIGVNRASTHQQEC